MPSPWDISPSGQGGSKPVQIPEWVVPVPNQTQHGIPTLKMGSRGMYVAYVQNLLNARIPQAPVLWVDGIFGPKTDQRVRQFQAAKRLDADGIVGPLTWAALEAGPPPIKKRPG